MVDDSVTLHSSWRGIIASFAGALIVLGIGAAAVALSGLNLVTGFLLLVGVGATLGMAFDYPIRSTFQRDGVVRRSLLRQHHIEWDRVRQLSRTRPGFAAALRRLRLGGLVAVIGRRRYLLVDQVEAGSEYDALDRVLGDMAESIGFDMVIRPGDEVAPTWIYRNKRWQPDP